MKGEIAENPFNVGDILHYQLHVTALTPEFFRVTKVMPKSVLAVEIGTTLHDNWDGHGQSGTYVPDVTKIMGKEKMCVLRAAYSGEIGVLVDSYFGYVATKWDGKPKEFYGD